MIMELFDGGGLFDVSFVDMPSIPSSGFRARSLSSNSGCSEQGDAVCVVNAFP